MLPIRQLTRSLASRSFRPAATAISAQFTTSSHFRYANRDDLPSNNDPKDPNQPYIPNRSPTAGQDVPKVGAKNAPPEFLGSIDPEYKPQEAGSGEAKAGEISGGAGSGHGPGDAKDSEWAKFIAEPLKRVGEDDKTMRARLFYQSRKRGILETDLLLSTFADEHLPKMTTAQMTEYDNFLDENDWDIYYWCTQDPPANVSESETNEPNPKATHSQTYTSATAHNTTDSKKTASKFNPDSKIQPPSGVLHVGSIEQPMHNVVASGEIEKSTEQSIEWAQTIGSSKVAYRPVPDQWKDSWVLKTIRAHVESRRARGESEPKGMKGLGRMPELKPQGE